MTTDDVPQETAQIEPDPSSGDRPRSMLSYAALVLGLASAAALLHLGFLLVAALGVVVSLLAMRRVSRFSPELGGWRLAVAGLGLSLVFAAAAVALPAFENWRIERDGRQFVDGWLEFLESGQSEKAHHLMLSPQMRLPIDEDLTSVYANNANRWAGLQNFVAIPEIRTLLALGDSANVRLYSIEAHESNIDLDDLALCYAVTFDEAGRKKTFFLLVGARRHRDSRGSPAWQIQEFHGGYRPKAFAEEESTEG